jgi:ABC-2 type transport system ATP-binding protein
MGLPEAPTPPKGDMTTEAAIRLEGVVKEFGDFRAVSELDLTVPRGSIYGLLGPNGSGKTTTIRMIMGILGPDRGRVLLFGDPRPGTGARGIPSRGTRASIKKMKVLEQLVFLARIRGVPGARPAGAGPGVARPDGARDRASRRVEDLSKGMQQKVQFIGTVLHEPDLLVLDEPFSGLDPINQDVLGGDRPGVPSEGDHDPLLHPPDGAGRAPL